MSGESIRIQFTRWYGDFFEWNQFMWHQNVLLFRKLIVMEKYGFCHQAAKF